jgi:membrane protein
VTVVGGLVVLYTAAPKLPVSARRALPGAVFGGGGWVVTTWIFGWYIKSIASYNRVYGSIGGMIVLMVWLYVAGLIILLGAELNGALYRRRHGF